jgi:DDE family transposase
MGKGASSQAHAVRITAAGGGSHARRNRLWTRALHKLADESGMAIAVRHFPAGTRKWKKLAHRLWGHMTEPWRGRPLIRHEVSVNCIGHTTTNPGLTIQAAVDKNALPPV